MENKGNISTSLCKAGCGFFGNAQFDGMCSKCYKDALKRKQSTPTVADNAGRTSPQSSCSSAGVPKPNIAPEELFTTPSVETASPTVPVLGATAAAEDSPVTSGNEGEGSGTDSPSKAKKRNRCYMCKKKVGLTGFECRCGGLYCSVHRYSDKHGCKFDYKEHGADLIRKNNPVVVGEKVQKI